IEREDALPKSVCVTCAHKLDEFHKFRTDCAQVGLNLQSSLKNQQQQNFPLEPECCLQEVEPVSSSVKTTPPPEPPQQETESCSISMFSRADSPTMKKLIQRQGLGDLVITPVIPGSQNEVKSTVSWPHVGHPTLEDYVLMKEDTFTVESSFFDNHDNRSASRLVASGQIEFHPNHIGNSAEQDKDILLAQRRKREILPPMWDVYEKVALSAGKENADMRNSKMIYAVTRRRYIISKGAFPCSLCKRCFRINQGFDREGSEWRDIYEGDENSADFSNSKSSDYDEAGGSNTPKDIKFFSCHICCKVFPRRSSLKRHQRTHMDRKLFSCPLCQKGFNRKEHLSRHMMSHSGGRPFNCDICEKPFTRKEHLSRHRLCHYNEALNYTAVDNPSTPEMPNPNSNDTIFDKNDQEMPAIDLSGNNLSAVNILVGQDDDSSSNIARPYVCDICGQGFARKEHLLRHQLRTHRTTPDLRDELKPYICNVCGKNFTRKEHLVRHQKIHMRDFMLGTPKGVIPGTDVSVSPVLTNRASSSGGTVMKTEPLEGLIPHSNFPGLSVTTVPVKSEQTATWDDVRKEPNVTDQNETAVNGQDDDVSIQSSLQENMEQVGSIKKCAEVDEGWVAPDGRSRVLAGVAVTETEVF
ncbi:hypothetical protein L9F63_002533, partial [Diploptera punctata]